MSSRITAALALAALLASGCAHALATCRSLAECEAHDGARVEVIGTYTLAPSKGPGAPKRHVWIRFAGSDADDTGGVLLGAWRRQDMTRSAAEVSRLLGRRVRVVGTFHREMPDHPRDPPHVQRLDGPCVHPIRSVRALKPENQSDRPLR